MSGSCFHAAYFYKTIKTIKYMLLNLKCSFYYFAKKCSICLPKRERSQTIGSLLKFPRYTQILTP